MQRRFFLVPDNELQDVYILCTQPLTLMLVKFDGLEIVAGEQDDEVLESATIFYQHFSSQQFELKRKT